MRLFLAIQFTDRIKNALSYLQQDMRDCGLKGNWLKENGRRYVVEVRRSCQKRELLMVRER